MEDTDIDIISSSDKIEEISEVIQKFVTNNENVFTFTGFCKSNKRVLLWTALFQHLQNKSSAQIHLFCLTAIRVLSRDKEEMDNLICEKWIVILIEKAGLYNYVDVGDDINTTIELPKKDMAVEALKCLCNITFNSEVARALCAHTSIAQGLVSRFKAYKGIPFKDDLMLFDMKLLFILTALRHDIKSKIRDELNGIECLIDCLNDILQDTDTNILQDTQQAIVCEILKAQFNLLINCDLEEPSNQLEIKIYSKLMTVLSGFLQMSTTSENKLMELRSGIANLLTSVHPTFYHYLTPELKDTEKSDYTYEGKNMNAIQALVELLSHRLNITTGIKNQYENLSPILTVLNKSARGCRAHRKYLRQVVLPPLRDVSNPPEKGSTLRNQLCKLLTTPVTSVRDLVAEFLFILCKEKVGRMVKYTGFGNAAGHLAQKGLLCGGSGVGYSSSSDDSDTEEYREAQPLIDPVVGCTRPPRSNPFENMSEEQKEYEAMKLVNLFDKMVSDGLVRPARIGEDGRPEPIDHVLQLRDDPPNRPQS